MHAATFGRADAPARPSSEILATLLVAGSLATAAFGVFGESLSPALGFATLAPAPLANSVIEAVTGSPWMPGAEALHYATGLVAYPLGWLLVARPLARRLAPGLGWLAPSIAYGVALWVFALFVMAHLVAGMPAFLGFGGIAWVALAGHVVYAAVVAAVIERRAAT